jgi:hypothetical protein
MPFPNTRQALEANGYSFKERKTCKCGAVIELFDTPRGRVIPLDFRTNEHNVEICETHFVTCPNASDYSERLRNKKEKEKKAAEDSPMSPDGEAI